MRRNEIFNKVDVYRTSLFALGLGDIKVGIHTRGASKYYSSFSWLPPQGALDVLGVRR
jgi:hypothetical protein